jgi:hypothetical protein
VVIRIGNNENARNNSNPISFMIKCWFQPNLTFWQHYRARKLTCDL